MPQFPGRCLTAFLGNFGALVRRPSRRSGFHASMSQRKYYAIRVGKGGYRGIVTSWAECQRFVVNVSNAQFKKFSTLEDAQVYAGMGPSTVSASSSIAKSTRKKSSVTSKLPKLTVFTDGACSRNGQHGARAGYGVFFGVDDDLNISERLAGDATNQRAEMTAVVEAMKVAFESKRVSPKKGLLIMTDSKYTMNGMTQWIKNWKKNEWKTSTMAPVKNKDLWVKLDAWQETYTKNGIAFEITWVKGHDGTPGNEAADRLAVAGLQRPLPVENADEKSRPARNPAPE